MRSTGLWLRLDLRMGLPPFNDLKIRFRAFAAFPICHCAMLAPDVGVQRMTGDVLIPFGGVLHKGVIGFLDFALLELGVEVTMRFGSTSKNHHPRGDFIQSMHDPDFAEFLFERFAQEGRVLIPALWQDGNPGGFVEDDDLFVLADDIEHGDIMPQNDRGRLTVDGGWWTVDRMKNPRSQEWGL